MTDSNTVEAPFRVDEPFIANVYADLIIRSSDGHDFHVLKGNLAMVSTIFKVMFSLPQPRAAEESDIEHVLPVVDVSEPGPVVDALLRYICPANVPNIVSVDVAFGIWRSACDEKIRDESPSF
ncbi:uncharacterized protein FOMMEDRAFT_16876, partial [Fomitiporia mediterranea MF3/22]|uniref:uncharacterized protein n=1 Tax=Fomitiporia mediterranea (strain MF3/22) TaxID=694068 RepID=UPI0004408661